MKTKLTKAQINHMETALRGVAKHNTYAEIIVAALDKQLPNDDEAKARILSGSFANMFEVLTVINMGAQSTAPILEIKGKKK